MSDVRSQIIAQINAIISDLVGVEPDDIDPSAEFLADYNADQETLEAVVSELSHQFPDDSLNYTMDEIANLVTVKDLYDLTLEKLNEV